MSSEDLNLKQSKLRINQRRWLVVILMVVFALTSETLEHYQPGQALTLDPHFIRELFLYIVILSLAVWLLIRLIDSAELERINEAKVMDHYFASVQDISKATNWQDLLDKVINFPAKLFTGARTSFWLYDLLLHEFIPSDPSTGLVDDISRMPPTNQLNCRTCDLAQSTLNQSFKVCNRQSGLPGSTGFQRYCLPLINGDQPVGLLTINLPTTLKVKPSQAQILNNIATEMALAINNARLRFSISSQAAASEAQFQQIARNLHDTLGQNISYLHLKLDQLTGEDALREISSVKQDLERMRDISEEAYRQVRSTLEDLQTETQGNLANIILERARAMGERAHFIVTFNQEGQYRYITPSKKQQLDYITREVFYNIERHANAKNISILLNWHDNGLTLTIKDDGQGFITNKIEPKGHYGLQIMQERVRNINGQMTITSNLGSGTEVKLWIPLEHLPDMRSLQKKEKDERYSVVKQGSNT
jgi:signal transduction histidine kinase